MSAGVYDLTVEQGSTYTTVVTYNYTGIDFSGYTARAKILSSFSGSGTTLATFTVTNGAQTVGSYTMTLSLTDTQTAALSASASGRTYVIGYWDLEIVNGAIVTRILQGKASLSLEATV